MAQFAYPSSDITNPANITGSYLDIDEGATPSDSDYIHSENNSSDTYECAIGTVTDPVSSANHIVRWKQAQADSNAGTVAPSSGGTNSTYSAWLYQGTTLIATLRTTDAHNESSFLEETYTLTSGEADNITDYTDLRFRITFFGTGGAPNNRRAGACSWMQWEVPDFVAVTRRIFIIS